MGKKLSYETDSYANRVELILRVGPKRELARTETIKLGKTYKIEPDNPQRLKNRGRTCKVIDFIRDDLMCIQEAKVTFLDDNKTGVVDIRELISI